MNDPCSRVISSQELAALVGVLGSSLSRLESAVLTRFMEGVSYEAIAAELGCDAKAVDNALQRIKRKVGAHLAERA